LYASSLYGNYSKLPFMKSLVFIILIIIWCIATTHGQNLVQGKIQDTDGNPLPGVNVLIKGSFDGATTDGDGNYSFSTSRKGEQLLISSFLGYKTLEIPIIINDSILTQNLELENDSRQLKTVVITAGTFEAGDQRKSVTLQPLDIVTTPSAAGDIYGMLNSLPGSAMVGEDGRLFVRGGDGYESKTFIDGMMVRKPYSSTVPDLPSRGRFSPFLFSGTTFSTGGYSAGYSQALSSALILNTNSFPENTQTEISLMSVGVGATHTLKRENAAFSLGLEYSNLKPYFNLTPQSYHWNQHPTSMGATLSGHLKSQNEGVVKFFSTFSNSGSGLQYPDLAASPGDMQDIALTNSNFYGQVTAVYPLKSWVLHTGISLGYDADSIDMKRFSVQEKYLSAQGKVKLSRIFSDYFKLQTGAETALTNYGFDYREKENNFAFDGNFTEILPAIYMEAESRPFSRLALRTGLRHEYSSVIDRHATAWRLSAAWLLTKDWQASLAAGSFYQTPEEDILRYATKLRFEKALHYIANVQYEKDRRLFRAELYQKDYNNLVTFYDEYFFDPKFYKNNGGGYARGLDLFFRDRETIRNLDYWISYSWVDAKRMYRSYPAKVRPHFAPEHTLTLVGKQWVNSINTLFGITASVASGRPYHNPNKQEFMSETTRGYSDVSINASHLLSLWGQQTILYASVSNLLGVENIFSYRYYLQPDSQGQFTSLPVGPPAKRFWFVGIFVTIR
jgi:hypothetical protein